MDDTCSFIRQAKEKNAFTLFNRSASDGDAVGGLGAGAGTPCRSCVCASVCLSVCLSVVCLPVCSGAYAKKGPIDRENKAKAISITKDIFAAVEAKDVNKLKSSYAEYKKVSQAGQSVTNQRGRHKQVTNTPTWTLSVCLSVVFGCR